MATLGDIWVSLGLDTVQYDRGIAEAESRASGLANFLKNSFQFSVGQMMFSAITSGIKSAWDASVGFNSQMEQNQIAFSVMMGDAQKAKDFLQALQQMAVQTPFQMQDLTDASKKLMAFGFQAQQIPPMLTAIGDAASGLGLQGSEGINRIVIALGQMSAKGKVQAGEMMQLTEAGIPAWDILAKAMGKSTAEVMKMSEKGLIPAKQAVDALVAGMEERFPKMMDKQSKTFSGLMSTIKDALEVTLGNAAKSTFNKMEAGLSNIADRLQLFSQALQQGGLRVALMTLFPDEVMNKLLSFAGWIQSTLLPDLERIGQDAETIGGIILQTFGGAFEALLPILQSVLSAGLDTIAGLMDWFAQHGAIVQAALVGIAAGFGTLKVVGIINELMKVFNGTSIITTGVMGILNLVMKGVNIVLGIYKMQLVYAAAEGVVTTGVMGVLNGVMATFGAIMSAINWPLTLAIAAIGVLAGVATLVVRNWQTVGPFFSALFNYVGNVIETAVHSFVNMFQNLWAGITSVLANIGNSVSTWVSNLAQTLTGIPVIGELFTGWSNSLGGATSAMSSYAQSVRASADANRAYIGSSSAAMSKAWADVTSTGGKALSSIGSDISGIVGSVKSGVSNMFKSVEDGSKVLVGDINKDFNTTVQNAKDAGAALQQAMADGDDGKGKKKSGSKTDIGQIIKESYGKALTELEGTINRLLLPTKDLGLELKNEQEALQLTSEKISLLNEEYKKMVEAKGENSSEANQVLQAIESEKTAYQSLSDKIAETTQKIKDLQAKQRQDTIDGINNLSSSIVDALQNMYQKEQKAAEDNLNLSLNNISAWKDAQLKSIEDVYSARVKAIDDATEKETSALQKQLNLLDAQDKKKNRDKQNQQDSDKVATLQAQIAVETDPTKLFDLKQQLAQAEQDQKEHLSSQAEQDLKDSIQKQINDIKQAADDKKKIWQDEEDAAKTSINNMYNAEHAALQRSLDGVRVYYADKLTQANLNAEAEKLLTTKSQEDIIKLLTSYGDAYKITGSSLGAKLYDGIRSYTDKISSLVMGIISQINIVQSMTGGSMVNARPITSMPSYYYNGKMITPDSELNAYGQYQFTNYSNDEVNAFRKVYGNVPKMHDGGPVGTLGLKSNEALRILQDGEFVLPKKVVSFLGNLFSGGGNLSLAGAGGGSGTQITVDVHDNNFKDGSDLGSKLVDALRRAGI